VVRSPSPFCPLQFFGIESNLVDIAGGKGGKLGGGKAGGGADIQGKIATVTSPLFGLAC
jgi:hypothetical protein